MFLDYNFDDKIMSTDKFVQIRGKNSTRDLLAKLSDKHGRKQYEFLDQTLQFFKETGFDPKETEFELPGAELKKLRNSLVSFIRKQEKDILRPLASQMDEFMTTYAGHIANSNPDKFSSTTVKEEAKPETGLKMKGLYMPGSDQVRKDSDSVTKIQIEKEKLENQIQTFEKKMKALKNRFSERRGTFSVELTEVEFESIFNVH